MRIPCIPRIPIQISISGVFPRIPSQTGFFVFLHDLIELEYYFPGYPTACDMMIV